MNRENTVETTGESVEEAIEKGLSALNARPMEVIIEVLEEPVKGVFGLESRPARVRVQRIAPPSPPPPPAPPPQVERPRVEPARPPQQREADRRPRQPEQTSSERRAPERERDTERPPRRTDARPARERDSERPDKQPYQRPAQQKPDDDHDAPAYMDDVTEEDNALPFADTADEIPEAEYDDEVSIGKVVLGELLQRMDLQYRIVVRRAQPDNGSAPWILDIYGANVTRLIGRRGETLASLQYIARLITSRELQRRSEIIVDVESYKSRRAKTLFTLAQRMAEEAVARNRVVSLEPMPPHERRIIHLALRGREDVETRSVGEGIARKVTIVPKGLA